MADERLQKIVARAGIASRRKAEELILAGRVTVDGRVVSELGARADARRSRIEVDGRRITAQPFVYVVFHKPRGVVSTMKDPEGRPTVAEYFSKLPVRVVPVGRLDFHTSGVLLMTNDGDFAVALAHPRKQVEKEYAVKVQGVVSDEDLDRFRRSIVIDGRRTVPANVSRSRIVDDKTWLLIRLHEGRNRQVRRLAEAAGFTVMRLARVEYAGITTEGLKPGKWRHLTQDELIRLKQSYGVPKRIHSPAPDVTRAPSSGARGLAPRRRPSTRRKDVKARRARSSRD